MCYKRLCNVVRDLGLDKEFSFHSNLVERLGALRLCLAQQLVWRKG